MGDVLLSMREPSRLDVALFSYEEDEGSSSLVTVPILNLVPFTPDLTFSHELGVKRIIVTVFHALASYSRGSFIRRTAARALASRSSCSKVTAHSGRYENSNSTTWSAN